MANRAARLDEADEKEDPLVRRREGLVQEAMEEAERLVREAKEQAERLIREAKAEGKRMVSEAKERAAIIESDSRALSEARRNTRSNTQELRSVCADLEAENEQHLSRLHPDLWQKIINENLHQNDLLAFALTCRFFREKQKDLGKKLVSNLKDDLLLDLRKSGKMAPRTLGWFRWVCDTLEIQPGSPPWNERVKGAVYESNLVNYAAFQGSVEILRWLMEEKGWELNQNTSFWAGMGGSFEVFVYLMRMGYELDRSACYGAARGGHLDVLKWLRSQDPPCPWGEETCSQAAEAGHLDVLKWSRSQDLPCPWDERTCSLAASKGHLEVLKWARSQDPPCPWNERTCILAAGGGHLDVLKWARCQDPPCPWSRPWSRPWSECRELASQYGQLHIINWIDQQEDEIVSNTF